MARGVPRLRRRRSDHDAGDGGPRTGRSLDETREAHAAAATLETPLEAAGLSPRAVSVAQGFDAGTVGELLGVPLHLIAKARGAGAVIRKELNRRHKQWTLALRSEAERVGEAEPGGPGSRSTRWPPCWPRRRDGAGRRRSTWPG